jgi:hypothetical protein
MLNTLRAPVGRTLLSGYLRVRPEHEDLFAPAPRRGERAVELLFGDGQCASARLLRSSGKQRELKLAFTGEAGAALRSWLKKQLPARKASKVRGVLQIERLAADRFRLAAERASQAEVELLAPGARRYLHGARPISVLHPALQDLDSLLAGVALERDLRPGKLATRLGRSLARAGWEASASVGAGLALSGGLRRFAAQLHPVLEAEALVPALVSLAAGFELAGRDLGVLLVADGRLAERLRRPRGAAASLRRAEREAGRLPFLVRGPICLIGLGARKEIR